jgi:hypothetical protein
MRNLLYLLFFCCAAAHAAEPSASKPKPPYLATLEAEGAVFGDPSCQEAAKQTLQNLDFVRVMELQGVIYGAYRDGAAYEFKASIKCLDSVNMAVITLVSEQGGALEKARQVLAGLQEYTVEGGSPAASAKSAKSAKPATVAKPSCRSGPDLIRCMNGLPKERQRIDEVIEYLESMKDSAK